MSRARLRVVDRFSEINIKPSVDAPYHVALVDVPAGAARRVAVEFRGNEYGRHAGTVRAIAGADTALVPVRTFVFPWGVMETVIRVAVVYLLLMVAPRIMGKRELGDLSPFEFVTLLLIPELLRQALVRDDFSLTNAIVAVSTLFGLVFATSVLSHRFPRFGRMMEGQPAVLVHDGKLVPRALNRERVAPDELFGEMHKAGLDGLARVRWAILNTDGRIAFAPVDDPHPGPAPAVSRPGAAR